MLCNRSVRAIKSRLVWEFEINSESRIDISDEFPVPLEILGVVGKGLHVRFIKGDDLLI